MSDLREKYVVNISGREHEMLLTPEDAKLYADQARKVGAPDSVKPAEAAPAEGAAEREGKVAVSVKESAPANKARG